MWNEDSRCRRCSRLCPGEVSKQRAWTGGRTIVTPEFLPCDYGLVVAHRRDEHGRLVNIVSPVWRGFAIVVCVGRDERHDGRLRVKSGIRSLIVPRKDDRMVPIGVG